jgi:hypothetical protein
MTRHLVLGGLLIVTALATPTEHTTFALWTTSVPSTSNYFSAGALHIGDSLAAGTTLSMDHLIAGDNFDAQLDVNNAGSLPLTYALTTTVNSDALGLTSALQSTVRLKTTNSCASRDGTVLYSGALSSTFIGDPAHGVQSGDRSLGAGATEGLCFTIILPSSVDSSLQAASASATFTLAAEQQ